MPCRHFSCKSDAVVVTYARTLRPPTGSFFLFGMRGVGKSTWARQQFSNAPRIDLLDEGVFQSYLRDPARRAAPLPWSAAAARDWA